jgi:hypothetical protein
LSLAEFIRRFRLHILPERFVKIRHYGLLANRNRHDRIAKARAALNAQPVAPASRENGSPRERATVSELPVCPHCHRPSLLLVRITHAPKNRTDYHDSS